MQQGYQQQLSINLLPLTSKTKLKEDSKNSIGERGDQDEDEAENTGVLFISQGSIVMSPRNHLHPQSTPFLFNNNNSLMSKQAAGLPKILITTNSSVGCTSENEDENAIMVLSGTTS